MNTLFVSNWSSMGYDFATVWVLFFATEIRKTSIWWAHYLFLTDQIFHLYEYLRTWSGIWKSDNARFLSIVVPSISLAQFNKDERYLFPEGKWLQWWSTLKLRISQQSESSLVWRRGVRVNLMPNPRCNSVIHERIWSQIWSTRLISRNGVLDAANLLEISSMSMHTTSHFGWDLFV